MLAIEPRGVGRDLPAQKLHPAYGRVLVMIGLDGLLRGRFGLALGHFALFTSLVLLAGVVGDLAGGQLSDELLRRRGAVIARRLPLVLGLTGSLVCLLPTLWLHSLLGTAASLAVRGTLALFGAASGPVPPFDPQRLNSGGSLFLTRPTMAHYIADRAELLWRAGELFEWLAKGELDVRIGGEYPLADARRAHEDLAARRTTGKLLLIP